MIVELEYSDVKITLEAKHQHGTNDALTIWGALILQIKKVFPDWGEPRTKVVCGLFCPHCGYENPPLGFLTKEGKCSHCQKDMLKKKGEKD